MKNKTALPTSAEITRRLRIVSELRNLCLSLGRAKRVGITVDATHGPNAKHAPDASAK